MTKFTARSSSSKQQQLVFIIIS